MDEAQYENARWWRNLNRLMMIAGVFVIAAIVSENSLNDCMTATNASQDRSCGHRHTRERLKSTEQPHTYGTHFMIIRLHDMGFFYI